MRHAFTVLMSPMILVLAGDWQAMLREPGAEAEIALLRKHTRTGRPCGDAPFVERLESVLGRTLRPQKPGPKPKQKKKR